MNLNNTIKCASRDDAKKELEKHLKPSSLVSDSAILPSDGPCVFYTEGRVDWEIWKGLRRLDGGTWTNYDFVAFSPNGKYLHLSEYWDDEAGIYEKVPQ